MARLTGLFFALALSKHFLFHVKGQHRCSSSGISGCECLFLGACDVHGKPKEGLNITKHLPLGLEPFGNTKNGGQNLAHLCEGRTVGILYDCNNRIPLYAAIVIRGSQFSGSSGRDSKRPRLDFRLSQSELHEYFQQSYQDYEKASQRKICFYERKSGKELVDDAWYRAKNSILPQFKDCIGAGSNDLLETNVNRGHLVASRYGVGSQSLKIATFVYTNAVPQFGDFNSVPWQKAEGSLVNWGRDNCAKKGNQNVQIFIVVGAIPSTKPGSSKPRYFGKKGFSDYQDDTDYRYRVNVPALMWTAACCTFEFTGDKGNTWQWGFKSTAFWRENDPGKLPVKPESVLDLERMLRQSTKSTINLFPDSAGECSKPANHVRII